MTHSPPQPSRIQLLSDQIINQIAAGEVVERPASVIKELLDNCLDAQADTITIHCDKGGLKRIQVADNGVGINREDLSLALTKHATSKISVLPDLDGVLTMGFRGEALAAIASVSELSLISRKPSETHAWQVTNHPPHETQPAALDQGTVVDVRYLFRDIPARLKFMRNENTEWAHCLEAIRRFALAQPQLAITVWHNGKQSLTLKAQSLVERVSAIFGSDFAGHCRSLDYGASVLKITGFLADPAHSATSRGRQYSYINQRFVRDRLISQAIAEGYRDVLHEKAKANWAIFLEMPGDWVDVNVHPAKTEVRFKDSQSIFRALHLAVGDTLAARRASQPAFTAFSPSASVHHNTTPDVAATHHAPSGLRLHNPLQQSAQSRDKPSYSARMTVAPNAPSTYPTSPLPPSHAWSTPPTSTTPPDATPTNAPVFRQQESLVLADESNNQTLASENALGEPPLGYAIAQLHGIYILAQNSQGLIVVDMHAAHERILYESLKNAWQNKSTVPVQHLLVPVMIDCDAVQHDTARAHHAELAELGFELVAEAAPVVKLLSTPVLVRNVDMTRLVLEMLDQWGEWGQSHVDLAVRNEQLASIACHNAVRAHEKLSIPAMNALLRQMENTVRADQCNHGRPTWLQLPLKQFDQWFMRGQ